MDSKIPCQYSCWTPNN